MCGRGRCTLRADDIPRACHRSVAPSRVLHMDRYTPSYNVSPGHNLPVVRREDASDSEGYVLHCMKWGLVPSFTKKTEKPDHYRMFNARSESMDEKASFRRLVPKNRCLVAVEGFYEWKKDGSRKQPYYIHFKDGRPLVFAALYDSWQNSEGEIIYTFTIVTTSSSSALQWLHDRMPVILGDKDSTDTWLSSPASSFKSVLKPYEESDLVWYPVTPAMGKPSFNGPECIKEVLLDLRGNRECEGLNAHQKPPPPGLEIQWIQNETPVELSSAGGVQLVFHSYKTTNMLAFLIQVKGNTSISMFFSRKGAEGDDRKPEQKILGREVVKTEHTKDLSEEAKTEEGDFKSGGSSHSQNVTKFPIKREYDEAFSADSKPALANNDQVSANPTKKKEKAKSADDKQPTLFSYFGKR